MQSILDIFIYICEYDTWFRFDCNRFMMFDLLVQNDRLFQKKKRMLMSGKLCTPRYNKKIIVIFNGPNVKEAKLSLLLHNGRHLLISRVL